MGYPTVNRAAVEGFLKLYNRGAIYILFDDRQKQAMVDFANVALKSYYEDLQEKAKQLLAKKQGQPAAPEAPPQPSLVKLTDA